MKKFGLILAIVDLLLNLYLMYIGFTSGNGFLGVTGIIGVVAMLIFLFKWE